jgi:hypothetical protein
MHVETAEEVLHDVTGKPVRPFSTRNFGCQQYSGACSVLVGRAESEWLLERVRKRLPEGWLAFIGTMNGFANPRPEGVELVAAPGTSPLDIVRVAASNGINYGLRNDDIIRELEAWHQEFGIDIWQAETDSIQLRFKTPPDPSFALRLFRFCPDLFELEEESAPAVAKQIAKTGGVALWWD